MLGSKNCFNFALRTLFCPRSKNAGCRLGSFGFFLNLLQIVSDLGLKLCSLVVMCAKFAALLFFGD